MKRFKTWINMDKPQDNNKCAVWIELGNGRLMWILENGEHGFSNDEDFDMLLSEHLSRNSQWLLL